MKYIRRCYESFSLWEFSLWVRKISQNHPNFEEGLFTLILKLFKQLKSLDTFNFFFPFGGA